MRRMLSCLYLSALLLFLLSACGTGGHMTVRLLCDRLNRSANQAALPPLTLSQFSLRQKEDALRYDAWWGDNLLLTAESLPNGRVHTVTLTGTSDGFYIASLCLTKVFTELRADEAERLLGQLGVGTPEVPGLQSREQDHIRLTYGANAAGCYLRLCRLREAPPEAELPTLRNMTEES